MVEWQRPQGKPVELYSWVHSLALILAWQAGTSYTCRTPFPFCWCERGLTLEIHLRVVLLLSHHLAPWHIVGVHGSALYPPQDPSLVETTFFDSAGTKLCRVCVQLDEPLHGHRERGKGYMDRAGDGWFWVKHAPSQG